MKTSLLILFFICLFGYSADRVVLMEEIVNSGCGFCWMEEPAIQEFVNQYLPSGNLGVIRVHCDYPNPLDPIYAANPIEQDVRKAHYNVTTQPYIIFDGVLEPVDGDLATAFLARLEEQSIISIQVARQGELNDGTISIMVIAEEDPNWECPMMVWPIIVEDGIPGVGYWTYSVFDQAFRDNLFGYFGQQIEFQGSYPDTIFVDAPYTIDPGWDVNQLYLCTILQSSYQSADDEVKNINWTKFIDIPMGISDSEPSLDNITMDIFPNPSPCTFLLNSTIPDNSVGEILVFDIHGRVLHRETASATTSFTLSNPGLYFVSLTVPGYNIVTKSITVIR